MMSGFSVKLVTAILVVFLVVDTCALLSNGCKKSLSRKTFAGKEGSFGCENVVISVKEKMAFRYLRSIIRWSPPPPAINRRTSSNSRAPPPQIL